MSLISLAHFVRVMNLVIICFLAVLLQLNSGETYLILLDTEGQPTCYPLQTAGLEETK